jgi:hypothetical protein
MAFAYSENKAKVSDKYGMYILFAEDSFLMDIHQFKAIVNIGIYNAAEANSYKMRRQSLKFGNLNKSQKNHLEYFIRFYTTTS